MAIKKVKLTSGQKDVEHAIDYMRKNPGSFLRKHMRPKGERCYRLLDENINPVLNLDREATETYIGNEIIPHKTEKGVWILNPAIKLIG